MCRTACIENPGTTKTRYSFKTVNGKPVLAHRAVYAEAHGPIPEGMVIMHLCDNPRCFNLEHLQVGTQQDNRIDCVRKGRANVPHSEQHYNAKLTAELVLLIRSSELSDTALSKQLGVSRRTVSDARKGITWRHI